MRSIHRVALLLGGLVPVLVPSGSARAQYIRPGGGTDEPRVRTAVSIEESALNALWELGSLKITPSIELRDVRYESDIRGGREGDERSDFTATVGAGLDFYLPVGNGYLTSGVHPAYSWWLENSERSRLIGEYSLEYFGDFNRLEVELGVERREVLDYPSSELLVKVPQRTDTARASLGARLTSSLWLRLQADQTNLRLDGDDSGFGPDEATLRRLDRDSLHTRAGLEWRGGERWRLGAGIDRYETDFELTSSSRSNEGDSPYLYGQFTGSRSSLGVNLVQTTLRPRQESDFVEIEEITGNLRLSLTPAWRISYIGYGARQLVYSFSTDQSHAIEDRFGVGLSVRITQPLRATAFHEIGTLEFEPFAGEVARPTEDFTATGIDLSWTAGERFALRLGGGRASYDSPQPGQDREITFLRAGLSATFGVVRVSVDAQQ